jgi:hypothetical protein
MLPSELFIEVVRGSEDLPQPVREHAHEASGILYGSFDESYIEFLDGQIRLGPRGVEGTKRLRQRQAGLRRFCNIPLISGHIRSGGDETWIKVDPKTKFVVYWEQYAAFESPDSN